MWWTSSSNIFSRNTHKYIKRSMLRQDLNKRRNFVRIKLENYFEIYFPIFKYAQHTQTQDRDNDDAPWIFLQLSSFSPTQQLSTRSENSSANISLRNKFKLKKIKIMVLQQNIFRRVWINFRGSERRQPARSPQIISDGWCIKNGRGIFGGVGKKWCRRKYEVGSVAKRDRSY